LKYPFCSICKNYHVQHDEDFPLFDCQLHTMKMKRLNEESKSNKPNWDKVSFLERKMKLLLAQTIFLEAIGDKN